MPAVVSPATSTDAYRRDARRLRCRFAGDPGRLHRSLKALADAPSVLPTTSYEDRQDRAAIRNPASVPFPQAASAGSFAEHVATSVTSPVLRYSQRLQLIRDARRFGISRFEANLVIAAILGRRRTTTQEATDVPDRSLVSGVTTFLLVQGVLALGAWWTLFR